jgi:hypothetical protein
MTIRVPGFLQDHPLESLFAVALLFGLLFIAADGTPPQPLGGSQIAASEKN